MKNVWAFLLLWLGLLMDATWFQIPPLHAVEPNLVLVVLVVTALTRGSRAAMILGALVGFIQDAVYGPFLGLNTFTYGALGYFAAVALGQFLQRNLVVTFLVTAVVTFLQQWLTYGLTRMLDVTAWTAGMVLTHSLWAVLMNGVALVLTYPLLMRWLQERPTNPYGHDSEPA